MAHGVWLMVDGGGRKMGEVRFSFEDLEVWQKAVDFAVRVIDIA